MDGLQQIDRGRGRLTSLTIPRDLDEAVKRFQQEDLRPTFNSAVLALLVEGLEARRKRKPLRPIMGAAQNAHDVTDLEAV